MTFALAPHGRPHQARPAFASLIALACVLTFGTHNAFAQDSSGRLADVEKRLDASLQLIAQLTQRLAQLEGKVAPAAAVAAPPPAPDKAMAARLNELEQQVAAIGNPPDEDRGLALHGFADVGWVRSSRGRANGGYVGGMDFYMTPSFGDRVKSLIELNFEVMPDGGVGVDLERLQLGYIASDALTLWLGRFHTPYGYWNNAFHHGAQLQTSVLRPRFLDFEDLGGILPAHSVGAWGTGGVKLGVGRLGYDVYLSNAPLIGVGSGAAGSGVLDMRQAGTPDRRMMIGGNLSFSLNGAREGLSVGAHTLHGRVGDDAASGAHLTQLNMTGLWAAFTDQGYEFMGELYRFNNRDLSGGSGTHKSTASYVQFGRDLGQFTPFVRWEKTALNQADAYFAQQASGQSYKRVALGLRWELNSKTALKFEADRTTLTDRDVGTYTEFRSQLAVRF